MADFVLPHDHGDHTTEEHLLEHLEKTENFTTLAELFKILDDASRLKIFWLLCHCEECVINISAMVGMSSPAVSHHLRQLKACGLIVSRRSGKEVYYKAADSAESNFMHHAIEELMQISCPE